MKAKRERRLLTFLYFGGTMTTEYLNNKTFEAIIARFQRSKKQKTRYELIIEDLTDCCNRKLIRNNCFQRERELLFNYNLTYEEIQANYTASQKELASAFYTLSENIIRYTKFNLIDADDAVQEGVMICFDKMDRFVPKKGKAFNYFTTCILNHFRQLYRTARNYNELKKKYHDFLQIQLNCTIIKNGKEVPSGKI